MILGLDVSSTTTAYTILDKDGNLIETKEIKLAKFKGMFSKAQFVENILAELKLRFEITEIFIEAALISFTKGFSSLKTIAILHRFNAVVGWMCYKIFGVIPEYLNVLSARRIAGVVYDKTDTSKLKTKKAVLKQVLALDSTFPVVYNKLGNIAITVYDRADSYIVAYAGLKGAIADKQQEECDDKQQEIGDSE